MLPNTERLYALWAQTGALIETATALGLPVEQLRAWRSATAATLHLHAAQALAQTLLDRQETIPPADLKHLTFYLRGIAYHTTPQDESDWEAAATYAPELPELDARLPHLQIYFAQDAFSPDIEASLGLFLKTDTNLEVIPEVDFHDLESLLAFTARLRQDLQDIESQASEYFPARRAYVGSQFPEVEADHV